MVEKSKELWELDEKSKNALRLLYQVFLSNKNLRTLPQSYLRGIFLSYGVSFYRVSGLMNLLKNISEIRYENKSYVFLEEADIIQEIEQAERTNTLYTKIPTREFMPIPKEELKNTIYWRPCVLYARQIMEEERKQVEKIQAAGGGLNEKKTN